VLIARSRRVANVPYKNIRFHDRLYAKQLDVRHRFFLFGAAYSQALLCRPQGVSRCQRRGLFRSTRSTLLWPGPVPPANDPYLCTAAGRQMPVFNVSRPNQGVGLRRTLYVRRTEACWMSCCPLSRLSLADWVFQQNEAERYLSRVCRLVRRAAAAAPHGLGQAVSTRAPPANPTSKAAEGITAKRASSCRLLGPAPRSKWLRDPAARRRSPR